MRKVVATAAFPSCCGFSLYFFTLCRYLSPPCRWRMRNMQNALKCQQSVKSPSKKINSLCHFIGQIAHKCLPRINKNIICCDLAQRKCKHSRALMQRRRRKCGKSEKALGRRWLANTPVHNRVNKSRGQAGADRQEENATRIFWCWTLRWNYHHLEKW